MFQSPEPPQSSDGDVQVPDTPPATDDLEALAARRTSLRKRASRAGLVALPVLIALALVLYAFQDTLPAWTGIGASATATAAAAWSNAAIFDSLNTITVTSNVTFGTLTLNGKRVHSGLPWQIILARGKNTITLAAPPFAPRTCTIHAPIPTGSNINYTLLGQDAGPGCSVGPSAGDATTNMELAMPLSLHDLEPALQRNALATVEQMLATMPGYTGTVQPGDYYAAGLDANGLPIALRATEPLTAQLSYALADPATQTEPAPMGCGESLCPGVAARLAKITAPVWMVDVVVAGVWRFTTASGEVAGQAAEPQQSPSVLALSYDPSAGWEISDAPSALGSQPGVTSSSSPYADPCGAATQILFHMLEQQQGAPSGLPLSGTPSGLQACKLQIADQPSSPQATFIYMFGALLAANDGAHNFLPSLPMAPPSEVASAG